MFFQLETSSNIKTDKIDYYTSKFEINLSIQYHYHYFVYQSLCEKIFTDISELNINDINICQPLQYGDQWEEMSTRFNLKKYKKISCKTFKKTIEEINNIDSSCIIQFNSFINLHTAKIIYILSNMFEEIYVGKPGYSSFIEPNICVVCINFKKKIQINCNDNNDYVCIIDIEIPEKFNNSLIEINKQITNACYIIANEFINFIQTKQYSLIEQYKRRQKKNYELIKQKKNLEITN